MAEIHQDAVAPYFVDVEVTSEDPSTVDLSSASAPEFLVLREDGTESTWIPGFLVPPTAGTALLRYVFQPGDLPQPEILRLVARLTITAGTVVAEARTLIVRPEFA